MSAGQWTTTYQYQIIKLITDNQLLRIIQVAIKDLVALHAICWYFLFLAN